MCGKGGKNGVRNEYMRKFRVAVIEYRVTRTG